MLRARCGAAPVGITRFMIYRVIGEATLDQWIALEPHEYLQGALLQHRTQHAVCVVTVDASSGPKSAGYCRIRIKHLVSSVALQRLRKRHVGEEHARRATVWAHWMRHADRCWRRRV